MAEYNAINNDIEQPLTQEACKIPRFTRVKFMTIYAAVWLVSFCVNFLVFKRAVHSFLFEKLSFSTMSSCDRRMLDSADTCDLEKMAIIAAAGGVVGVGLATGALFAVGLSSIGPIAGGAFAASQGAGVTAGSLMAIAQSAAMTGSYVGTAWTVGTIAGAIAACSH